MSKRQHGVFKGRFEAYLLEEYPAILRSAALGAVLAAFFRLVADDLTFRAFVKRAIAPFAADFDGLQPYAQHLLITAACLALILLLRVPSVIRRGSRSWTAGVV
ncbi:MAG: hypothetical protein ACLPND_08095, partial [Candidatus Korobacteraceae bacterium]